MLAEKVPVFKPLIEQEEYEASRVALELGWLGMGSYVGQFEEALKDYLGASDRFVAAVNTGHAALHLGLLAMGVGSGDEVITPSFNNAADFQAILATGAQPVFCDIDEDSLCIDLDKAAIRTVIASPLIVLARPTSFGFSVNDSVSINLPGNEK